MLARALAVQLGACIDELGVLLRDGDTLVFRRDLVRRLVLDARRVELSRLVNARGC
jgi:hypothetical protein